MKIPMKRGAPSTRGVVKYRDAAAGTQRLTNVSGRRTDSPGKVKPACVATVWRLEFRAAEKRKQNAQAQIAAA